MLHQRLSSADGETAGHDFQAVTVLAQFLGCPGNGDGDAVAHGPGVRVVTVLTAPHAAGRPGNDANTGAVHGRAGGVRMKESHIAGGESGPDVRFWNVLAEVDAELKRAFGLQGNLLKFSNVRHG